MRQYNSNTVNHANLAKNVVLFVGDGMGITTVTAARILKSQMAPSVKWNGQSVNGETSELSFDAFEHIALAKVCYIDKWKLHLRQVLIVTSLN